MRVLITGGYGFIGSYVTEKFNSEGHDVYIIDNLITGNLNNVKCKHRFYNVNIEDPECEEIFKSNRFDVVIHLAAQVNVDVSMEDPYIDTKSNVLGLANILRLSEKYGVKKVVFASSAAVYGLNEEIPLTEDSKCNPLSPYGINKWIGEQYCEKWKDIYGLDTLCFRFSNVYGPKQGTVGEGGVISIFIERVLQKKELVVYGDGEQTRDFIYVKDVAYAIYRGVEYGLSGVFNLSTNTEISINQIIVDLGTMADVTKIVYEKPKAGDIKHSRLDNSIIKKELDWVPLHNFREGLEKTYEWFKEHDFEKKNEKITKMKPKWVLALESSVPYFENLSIYGLFILLGYYFHNSLSMVDYQLFYIVVASFLLGRNQSILSIGLGSIWFISENILNGRELISLMMDHNTLVHIGLYLFVGLTIGYLLDKKGRTIENYRLEAKKAREDYQSLYANYQEALTVKEELQNQVLYTNDSFGTIYNVMKELDYLDPVKTYTASISIIERVMKSNKVAFYIVDQTQNTLKIVAKSDGLLAQDSLVIADHESIVEVTQTSSINVNKSLGQNQPSMIAPISIEGNLVGVLCLYQTDFEYTTLFYRNLLTIIADLISSALHSASQHQEVIKYGNKRLNIPTGRERKKYG